jgi:site-specific DNA-methyltransferase (cytosine-N4-specific)
LELAVLKTKINLVDNANVKDLLLCAFSKIIVRVSNQDSEVRYTAKNKNIPDGVVYSLFVETLLSYVDVLKSNEYSILAKTEIFNGDTLCELKHFTNNHFDFVMTSPPYINTFDYYLYHKLRMFWLDYDHRPIRQKEIGNHHRIDTKDFTTAKKEYVDSMSKIMTELSRVSKPKSNFVMIIGDGIVDGITIDMSQVIAEISQESNYKIQNIESVNLSDITRSFNKKFSNAAKKEHNIILTNDK